MCKNLKTPPKGRRTLFRNMVAVGAGLALGIVPGRLFSQSKVPAEAQKGVQILLLGTHGGPVLSERRSEPSTLLIVDGHLYLIDCGIGTARRMLDAGVESQMVGTIFLTHSHPDHVLGLVDVLANDFLGVDFKVPEALKEFHIYGPPETRALVRAAYNYIRIPYETFAAEPLGASKLDDPFEAHVIDHDGLLYQDDKIRVTAAENTHYQLMRAQYHASLKSYSYRFETPYGSIVFTGDTGPSSAVETLAKGVDVLISEVEDLDAIESRRDTNSANADVMAEHLRKEHLPIKAVGEMASKAQARAVILYHFVGGDDGARFAAGVRQYYSGPVFAGEDLARYCLGSEPTTAPSTSGALRPCQ